MPIPSQETPVLIPQGTFITSKGAPLSHVDMVAMVQRMIDRRAAEDAAQAAEDAARVAEEAAQAAEDSANGQAANNATRS